MTERLNTFKDYEKDIGIFNEDNLFQIKADAIKWIKKLNNINGFSPLYHQYQDSGFGEYTDDRYGNVIEWIMCFFNIEASDFRK